MFSVLRSESKSILGAATIVGVFSCVSRLMGFVRDRILAGQFGAGDTLDSYYAAFKIPDLLFQLLVIGAISASFIPIFLSYGNDDTGKDKAWKFTSNTLNLIVIGMLILTIVMSLFAAPLAHIVAPGFPQYKQDLVVDLMRVMFFSQMLLAVSIIFGSVLQGLKRFLIYSFAPISYNIGIIIGAVWFTDVLGTMGLAWGVVLGAFLHLLTQMFGMKGTGFHYSFLIRLFNKDAKKMFALMGPRVIGLAVNQTLFLMLSVIASTLAVGSVTIFQFAYNLQFFPVGIIGVSFAIAVFPSLSEHNHPSDRDTFVSVILSTVRQIVYLLVPLSLVFLIMRAQIVRLVVGAGSFDWDSTIMTADTLAFFALTFIPQSMVYVLSRAFFALHDTITPLVSGLLAAFVGILVAFLLGDSFGVVSLGIAFSSASVVQFVILWIVLRQRFGTLRESSLLPAFYKIAFAGLVSGCVMQFIKPLAVSILSLETFFGVLLQAFFAGCGGVVVYILVCQFLHLEEQKEYVSVLKRNILRKVQPTETVIGN